MSDDIKPEVIQNTQKILGKYVKKPPLTEKLLRKPPFRFLHDVVTAVVKDTGFLKGLYSEAELKSENVKERDAKIVFLNKLITAIKTLTNSKLAVKASKIVAGLEPTETNLLLQAIGKALDKKLDSAQYVHELKNGGEHKKTKTKVAEKKETDEKHKRSSSKQSVEKVQSKTVVKKVSTRNVETGKKEKAKAKRGSSLESPSQVVTSDRDKKSKSEKIKKGAEKQESKEVEKNEEISEEKPKELDEVKIENEEIAKEDFPPEEITIKPIERPKSAKPRSATKNKTLPSAAIVPNLAEKPPDAGVTGVKRPNSSLRPPSVRPSSAKPGAPRLRPESALPLKEMVSMGKINVIVENLDSKDDEEETVVIQSEPETESEVQEKVDLNLPQQKGHLVEQILEQINDSESAEALKEDLHLEDDFKRQDSASKEIGQLRNLIQGLTRTANPLGKLINYLHEDVEAMYGELNMWTATKRQTIAEIEKQKGIRAETSKPLQLQLEELQRSIQKQEEEVLNVRAKILRNDVRIKQLLSK